jgi:hypothetical protein
MEISRCFCAICSAVARRARRAGGSVVAGAGAGSGSGGGTSFGTGREPALPLAGAASGVGLAARPGLGAGAGAPFGAFAALGGAAGFAGGAGLLARDGSAGTALPGRPFPRGAAAGSGGTSSSCFAASRAMAFPFALAAALAFLDAIRQATPAISLDSL